MENHDEKRVSREEIIRRLNAAEELIGVAEAGSDPAEAERQRKLKNEIEKEQEINRGWFAQHFGAGG
ncbi:MAG: hypothetical protein AVDCRST_MAG93-6478 [uncultured Chloroflexia bacterium]|uniref:Uncharacterized protein n=1 Tax=uncultured Chloroflexia bacterium TaxID=1672391 RepID=A0A6J4LPP4_9CHLR|nr:MAG: hypothetical protein AVDCRST_MAG93-6478 [uncultured Chloroflexia bacterium]